MRLGGGAGSTLAAGCCSKQPPALRGLGQDGRRGGQDGVPRVGEESGRERCKGPCSHFSTCSVMVEAGLGAWGESRGGGDGPGGRGEVRRGPLETAILERQSGWRNRRMLCVERLGPVRGTQTQGSPISTTQALLKNHLVFLAASPNWNTPDLPSHHLSLYPRAWFPPAKCVGGGPHTGGASSKAGFTPPSPPPQGFLPGLSPLCPLSTYFLFPCSLWVEMQPWEGSPEPTRVRAGPGQVGPTLGSWPVSDLLVVPPAGPHLSG